ncbi:hypothetical protein PYW08_005089 [Mythimna loreyi]|uniref:Uncharacterized protein n=1 Tax=Mythimna loreyi TaxID=667449 RepID=A0ACC2QEM9_9NEOP|nr:hypothetical protein PYW08_005089 [Mythimna loreyi]
MNFNFVFISYSVIYAKYSYCYEVPKEQPQRYFDGKEWRIVKPRPNVRPKVARYSNITIDLDYAESPKEIKSINFEETTTQMPIRDKMTTTGTTKKATFKRVKKVQYRPPMTATKGLVTTTKKPVTPYRGSVTTTWKPKKPMNRPMMTTRKPATTIRRPTTTTKIPVTKPTKFAKLSGKQAYVGTPTENWPNLLKEFLKYVDEKKCPQPPCEHETTSTMAYSRYERIDHRKTIPKDDGLMNILMDGVEIDDRLFEEGNDGSKSKETLEYEGKRINYESFEGSLSQINNDYDDQNLKSLKDSIAKRRDITQESEINLDELEDKNTNEDDGILEDYEDKSYPSALETNHAEERYLNSQIRASEEYLDELIYEDAKKEEMLQNIETKTDSAALKDKEDYMFSEIKRSGLELDDSNDSKSQKGDNVLQATDIKSYLDTLKDKYVKEAYENSQIRGSEIHSDEIIDKNIGGENEVIENNVLNYFTDALKNDHTKKENEAESSDSYLDGENIRNLVTEKYLHDNSTETFISVELNETKDYTAPNPIELTSQTNNEDLLHDSDITFDLEDNDVKADKYPEKSTEA